MAFIIIKIRKFEISYFWEIWDFTDNRWTNVAIEPREKYLWRIYSRCTLRVMVSTIFIFQFSSGDGRNFWLLNNRQWKIKFMKLRKYTIYVWGASKVFIIRRLRELARFPHMGAWGKIGSFCPKDHYFLFYFVSVTRWEMRKLKKIDKLCTFLINSIVKKKQFKLKQIKFWFNHNLWK